MGIPPFPVFWCGLVICRDYDLVLGSVATIVFPEFLYGGVVLRGVFVRF